MTRLAILSDIHGHAIALEAVLADIDRQGVDGLICLGDVATLGPQPAEVLASLRARRCPGVLGNHDEALLHPERAQALHIPARLNPALTWCAERLTEADWAFLRACRPVWELPVGPGTDLLAYHGSPLSNTDSLLATTPSGDLDRWLCHPTAKLFVGGHTHLQMLRQESGRYVFNAGSVGSAFKAPPRPEQPTPSLLPWAEYALVTWDRGLVGIDLRQVPFDLAAFAALTAASDLPLRGWWLQQYAA